MSTLFENMRRNDVRILAQSVGRCVFDIEGMFGSQNIQTMCDRDFQNQITIEQVEFFLNELVDREILYLCSKRDGKGRKLWEMCHWYLPVEMEESKLDTPF